MKTTLFLLLEVARMYNLILADLFKLRKSMSIKILLGITSVSAVIVTVVAYLISHGKIGVNAAGSWFLFSDVNMISILGAAIACISICGDFENKIIHDAIANGCSRAQVIVSKTVVFSCAIAFISLPYAIVTCIAFSTGAKFSMGSISVGFLHMLTSKGSTSFSASQIWKLIAIMFTLMIVYISQLSICVPLALGSRKPVLVVVIYYGFTILCPKLSGLRSSYKIFDRIFSCTPYAGEYTFVTLNTAAGDICKAVCVSLIFIIAMIVVTYFIFRKSEIK